MDAVDNDAPAPSGMASGTAAGSRLRGRVGAYLRSGHLLTDLSGGVISGFVSITYGSSYAALLFSGPLEPYLVYGVSVTLLTAIIGAAVVCLTSSQFFSIAGPDSNTTSILSVLIASLATQLIAAGRAEEVLPHVMLMLFLCTLLTAVVLFALGAFRMGQWVRYIPYPVMGGFLAATGWLMTSGALGIVSDTPLTWEGLERLTADGPRATLIAAILLAGTFLFVLRTVRHVTTLPLLLVASILAVYGWLWLNGIGIEEARAQGWLFSGLGESRSYPPWELIAMHDVAWPLMLSHAGEVVATVIVATITILLCATGLEVATNLDIDLDRELRGHGLANLLTAGTGGYLTILSLARSLILVRAGSQTRVSGLVVGGMCATVLFGSPALVAYFPKTVLGAFLLYLGLSLLVEWLIDLRSRFRFWEYVLVITILVLTVRFGFTIGVMVGVIGACLEFAVNYSRVDAVRHDVTGVELRSRFERPQEEQAILDRHGGEIRIMVFQGFVFFGMAIALLQRVTGHVSDTPRPRFLVLDFSPVAGLDTSAAMIFLKAWQTAERAGVAVVLVGLAPRTRAVLENTGSLAKLPRSRIFEDLDAGLEWVEDRVIEGRGGSVSHLAPALDRWLLSELGDGIAVEYLKTYLLRVHLDAGEFLFRRAPSTRTLYLIDSGRIDLLAHEDSGSVRRLVSLPGGSAFGTEDLYGEQRQPTSARAEAQSIVYALSAEELERLTLDDPRLAARFYGMIMRLLAKRLRLANEEIGLLRQNAVARRTVRPAG